MGRCRWASVVCFATSPWPCWGPGPDDGRLDFGAASTRTRVSFETPIATHLPELVFSPRSHAGDTYVAPDTLAGVAPCYRFVDAYLLSMTRGRDEPGRWRATRR